MEDQMFAVQDPASGELGICSIMGQLGEHLAVAAYLGDKGMEGYRLLAEAPDQESASEAYVSQCALNLSFESRDMLDPEDRRIMKALGLKYPGAPAWPLFR